MPAEVLYAPLTERDIDELAAVLHNEAVYEYIGGMPSTADFRLWLQRALAGPPAEAIDEHWINVVARMAETGEIIGRLEASIHDDLAEVAFLFNPKLWGRGYATRGLFWLHEHLRRYRNVKHLWATTHPENQRSSALLLRCGYVPASTQSLPVLYSYEQGDHVFSRSVA